MVLISCTALQNLERKLQQAANDPEADRRKKAKLSDSRDFGDLDSHSEVCKVQHCRTPLDTKA